VRRRVLPERWVFPEPATPGVEHALAQALEVTPAFARILLRRGLTDAASADAFLNAKLDGLHDPLTLPDMPAAVARITKAVSEKERIVLFGDYDADGVSATALMAGLFRLVQTPVDALVPERDRGGYGLSSDALQRIRACKPQLVITLDNGIAANGPLETLRAEGIDAIVVDHHCVGAEGLPPALAVINPQRRDSTYPFDALCGAGLAFKLAWALAMNFSHSKKVSPEFRAFLTEALALAALGTIGDVVPLVGENRILALQGLRVLPRRTLVGVAALLDVCQLDADHTLDAYDVAFRIVPRLNAAGRCGQAADALELLSTNDPQRAHELAAKLDGLNRTRQDIEKDILQEARAQAVAALASGDKPVALVLSSPTWHVGVIGIVASRVVEEFHRPAVLLSMDEKTGLARGSGRSVRGFHLAEAFAAGDAHLLSHGGHAAAAGLSLKASEIDAFRTTLQAVARQRLRAEDLCPTIHLEETLELRELSGAFCAELRKLEPCGAGNPSPKLAALGVSLVGEARPMGSGEHHISFHARQGTTAMRVVGFGFGEHFNRFCTEAAAGTLDIAFKPSLNTFRGNTTVELKLEAFRTSLE